MFRDRLVVGYVIGGYVALDQNVCTKTAHEYTTALAHPSPPPFAPAPSSAPPTPLLSSLASPLPFLYHPSPPPPLGPRNETAVHSFVCYLGGAAGDEEGKALSRICPTNTSIPGSSMTRTRLRWRQIFKGVFRGVYSLGTAGYLPE